jgi:hypothetical protein
MLKKDFLDGVLWQTILHFFCVLKFQTCVTMICFYVWRLENDVVVWNLSSPEDILSVPESLLSTRTRITNKQYSKQCLWNHSFAPKTVSGYLLAILKDYFLYENTPA